MRHNTVGRRLLDGLTELEGTEVEEFTVEEGDRPEIENIRSK